MDYLLAIVLAGVGITIIIYRVKLIVFLFNRTQVPLVKIIQDIGFRSVNVKSYENFYIKIGKWALFAVGLILIFMAISIIFGPITF